MFPPPRIPDWRLRFFISFKPLAQQPDETAYNIWHPGRAGGAARPGRAPSPPGIPPSFRLPFAIPSSAFVYSGRPITFCLD